MLSRHDIINAYAQLEFTTNIDHLTDNEITRRYRQLLAKNHPDKFQDAAEKAAATASFHQIQTSYNIITKDRAKNRKLDEFRNSLQARINHTNQINIENLLNTQIIENLILLATRRLFCCYSDKNEPDFSAFTKLNINSKILARKEFWDLFNDTCFVETRTKPLNADFITLLEESFNSDTFCKKSLYIKLALGSMPNTSIFSGQTYEEKWEQLKNQLTQYAFDEYNKLKNDDNKKAIWNHFKYNLEHIDTIFSIHEFAEGDYLLTDTYNDTNKYLSQLKLVTLDSIANACKRDQKHTLQYQYACDEIFQTICETLHDAMLRSIKKPSAEIHEATNFDLREQLFLNVETRIYHLISQDIFHINKSDGTQENIKNHIKSCLRKIDLDSTVIQYISDAKLNKLIDAAGAPKNPDGFFRRHWKKVASVSVAGAILFGGFGLLFGLYLAPFTLGLSIPLGVLIGSIIGAFATGAMLGLGAGALACKLRDNKSQVIPAADANTVTTNVSPSLFPKNMRQGTQVENQHEPSSSSSSTSNALILSGNPHTLHHRRPPVSPVTAQISSIKPVF